MEGKVSVRLRPLRVINYLVLAVPVVFLYIVLRSYFLWVIMIIMLTCPVLSAAGAFYVCKRVNIELGLGKDTLLNGEEALLELRLRNPLWIPALQSEVSLSLSNLFLENETRWSVELPVKAHETAVLKLPLRFVNLGKFAVESDVFRLQDIMGLIVIKRNIALSGELYVLPRGEIERLPDVTNFMAGTTEVEESKHKGSDFSEVSDIREYVPGDRIRDIHWKISARQGELMVKERIAAAGSEMVILLNLVKNEEFAQQILDFGFCFAKSFIRQRLPVRIMCWNQADFAFEEYECGSEIELVAAYREIYRTKLAGRINEDWMKFLANAYPYLQRYLLVGLQDDKVMGRMFENG